MDTRPVLGVGHSLSGQAWAWRGGLAPGSDTLTGRHDDDELLRHLFAARGAASDDFDRLKSPTLRHWLPDPAIFTDIDRKSVV